MSSPISKLPVELYAIILSSSANLKALQALILSCRRFNSTWQSNRGSVMTAVCKGCIPSFAKADALVNIQEPNGQLGLRSFARCLKVIEHSAMADKVLHGYFGGVKRDPRLADRTIWSPTPSERARFHQALYDYWSMLYRFGAERDVPELLHIIRDMTLRDLYPVYEMMRWLSSGGHGPYGEIMTLRFLDNELFNNLSCSIMSKNVDHVITHELHNKASRMNLKPPYTGIHMLFESVPIGAPIGYHGLLDDYQDFVKTIPNLK